MYNRWELEVERDPTAHRPLNPFILTINQELRYLNNIMNRVSIEKLRQTFCNWAAFVSGVVA